MTSEPKELRGRDAEVFAEEHLKQVKVNPETWEVEYVDPETGTRWMMDYPNAKAHGGGAPRLRVLDGNRKVRVIKNLKEASGNKII